MEQLSIYLKL